MITTITTTGLLFGATGCTRPSRNNAPSQPAPSTMTAPPAPGALTCQTRRVGIAVFDPAPRDRDQTGTVLSMILIRSGVRSYRIAPSREGIVIVGAGAADEFARARDQAQRLGLTFEIEDTGTIGADCRVVFDHPPAHDPGATDPEARER